MSNAISEDNAVRAANEAFYQALSAGSIEGISAACAHDSDVTAFHETSTEVALGWQAVIDRGKAVPFESFAELSCVMTNPAVKVHGTIARVAGLERVRGKMKDGESLRSPRSARTFTRSAETGGSSCITMRARPRNISRADGD
jgi:ketosteroid isomerase-like protein